MMIANFTPMENVLAGTEYGGELVFTGNLFGKMGIQKEPESITSGAGCKKKNTMGLGGLNLRAG
jgi:hypothetical protein